MNKKSTYDKLDGLKAPIDRNETWNKISSREGFPKEKRKRRFFFWWFLVLGVLALIFSQLIGGDSKADDAVKAQVQNIAQDDEKNIGLENKIVDKAMDANSEIAEKGKPKSKTTNTAKSNSKETAKNIKSKTIEQVAKDNNVIGVEKIATANAHKKESKKTNETDHLSTYFLSADDQMPEQAFKNQKSLTTKNTEKKEGQVIQGTDEPRDLNNLPTEIGLNSSKKINAVEVITLAAVESIAFEPSFERAFIALPFLVDKLDEPNSGDQNKIDILRERPWAIEVGTGIGYGFHSLQYLTTTFQERYTKNLSSFLLNLRMSRKIKEKWRLALGLNYSNNRRKFSYTDTAIEYFRQQNPDPHYYYESIVQTAYTYYHNHQMLDIESLLFRDFSWSKTSAYAGLGLGLNLNYNFNGMSIDRSINEIDLNEVGDYKNNLGLLYLLEVGLAQQIKDRLYLNAAFIGKSKQQLNRKKDHDLWQIYVKLGLGFYL